MILLYQRAVNEEAPSTLGWPYITICVYGVVGVGCGRLYYSSTKRELYRVRANPSSIINSITTVLYVRYVSVAELWSYL